MTDQEKPEALDDDALDAVQGAGPTDAVVKVAKRVSKVASMASDTVEGAAKDGAKKAAASAKNAARVVGDGARAVQDFVDDQQTGGNET